MARRRWLSTNISIDGPVNRLAMQYGDFAALLFTWMIPQAGDDGAIRGDPEEILAQVMPHRRDVSGPQVAEALAAMAAPEFDLLTWDRARKVVRFKPESFRRHQSYITDARWRKATAEEAEPPEPAAIGGDNGADQRHKAALCGDDGTQQRTTPQISADRRETPLSFSSSSSFPSSSSSSSSLSSPSGEDPAQVGAGGVLPAREDAPPPPRMSDFPSRSRRAKEPNWKRPTSQPRPLPEDFALDGEMRAWAAEHYPLVDVEAQTAAFVRKRRSKGYTSCDWLADWEGWIMDPIATRDSQARASPNGHSPPARPPSKNEQSLAAIAGFNPARRDP